jgi:hypothetical protein
MHTLHSYLMKYRTKYSSVLPPSRFYYNKEHFVRELPRCLFKLRSNPREFVRRTSTAVADLPSTIAQLQHLHCSPTQFP